MDRIDAVNFLFHISWNLGTTGMNNLSEKDGETMRKAIEELEKGHNTLDFLTDRPCAVCTDHKDGGCTAWECPFDGAVAHEKQNKGHYEYGIFDGEGKLVGNIWDDGEFARTLCEERNARSIKKGYCVKKRLVMAWEAEDGEDGL